MSEHLPTPEPFTREECRQVWKYAIEKAEKEVSTARADLATAFEDLVWYLRLARAGKLTTGNPNVKAARLSNCVMSLQHRLKGLEALRDILYGRSQIIVRGTVEDEAWAENVKRVGRLNETTEE